MHAVLRRVFLRLYRQRNLIADGARVGAAGVTRLLRLAASLVGARIDRLLHVALNAGPAPLVLAAAAKARLEVLTPATAADAGGLVDLLD